MYTYCTGQIGHNQTALQKNKICISRARWFCVQTTSLSFEPELENILQSMLSHSWTIYLTNNNLNLYLELYWFEPSQVVQEFEAKLLCSLLYRPLLESHIYLGITAHWINHNETVLPAVGLSFEQ